MQRYYRSQSVVTLIFFVVFISCTHTKQHINQNTEIKINFEGIPEIIYNGDVYKVNVNIQPQPESFEIYFNKTLLSSWQDAQNGVFSFLLGIDIYYIPLKTEVLEFKIIYGGKKEYYGEKTVNICQKNRGTEKLNVDPSKVIYTSEVAERLKIERVKLKEFLKSKMNVSLWKSGFICPTKTCFVTSDFGISRVYNNIPKSYHSGTDLRAAVGSKIYAMSDSRVIYIADYFLLGNLVVLDHGYGIYSLYGHLSKILVQQGQLIEKGSTIGLAGKTGRATGPHLHWSVVVNQAYIDPLMFLKLNLFNGH